MQICYKGVWGTVCDRQYATTWNDNSANVVCRQLGFLELNQSNISSIKIVESMINTTCAISLMNFSVGAHKSEGCLLEDKLGPILLDSLHCDGSESSLSECKNYTIGTQLCPPGSRYGAVKCPS